MPLQKLSEIEEKLQKFNIGFKKLNPIDSDNKLVFTIKRAYLHLFNLISFFDINIIFL